MQVLSRTQFGDPILRRKARRLTKQEIVSEAVQRLIKNMQHTLLEKELGVGLAAPQIGVSIALAVIAVRPMSHRPDVASFDLVLINPRIVDRSKAAAEKWEGCISSGSSGTADLFAKVPRNETVRVKYRDQVGVLHEELFRGLQAHVIQHEIDHLNGVLFVDRVRDTKSYMTYAEYMRRGKMPETKSTPGYSFVEEKEKGKLNIDKT